MGFLRKHRLILVLCGTAVVLGTLEMSGRVSNSQESFTDEDGLSGESELLLELYPNSPEASYIRGMQARHLRLDLAEARVHFELALKSGIKAHPSLLYDYAVVLYLMEAEDTQIDAAIAKWERNDPGSSLLPPRSYYRPFPEWHEPGSIKKMALSQNGRQFAMVLESGDVSWVDVLTGERGQIAPSDSQHLDHLLGFCQDGHLLLATDSTGLAAIADLRKGNFSQHLVGHDHSVISGEFSVDANICATGDVTGEIQLWDPRTGQQSCVLRQHKKPLSSLAFSSDGSVLASGDRSGAVWLWTLNDEQAPALLLALRTCDATITDLAFSPDHRSLASAARDNKIRIYDADSGQELQTLVGHAAPVSCVAFYAFGRILASGSSDRTVRFWDLSTGREAYVKPIDAEDGVCDISFSEDGSSVVVADFNGSIHSFRFPRELLK